MTDNLSILPAASLQPAGPAPAKATATPNAPGTFAQALERANLPRPAVAPAENSGEAATAAVPDTRDAGAAGDTDDSTGTMAVEHEEPGAPAVDALLAQLQAAAPTVVHDLTPPPVSRARSAGHVGEVNTAVDGPGRAARPGALSSALQVTDDASPQPGPALPSAAAHGSADGGTLAIAGPAATAATAAEAPAARTDTFQQAQAQARADAAIAADGTVADETGVASAAGPVNDPTALPTPSPAATAATAPAPTAAPAAPAQAQLAAPPGSPAFASQFGTVVTTFIQSGIEQARLHLHPADMGPVSVQIQLDGTAAQVHLSADHPATRQALQEAMPLLAGSLREAGLTLAGGGVFEQPAQARQEAEREAAHARATQQGGADASAHESAPVSAATPRRRGVVDLVA